MRQKQKMLIPSIYVDLDDIVAETLRTFADLANRMYGKSVRFEHIFSLGESFDLTTGQLKEFMEAAHSKRVLLHEIDANSEARQILKEWAKLGTHITIVTGRPISTYEDTLEWLRMHEIPFHALRFLRKYGRNDLGQTAMRPLDIRTLPNANFLFAVEDNLKMVSYLAERVKVPVLLLDKPWNRKAEKVDHNPLVTRCLDWDVLRAKSLLLLSNSALREIA